MAEAEVDDKFFDRADEHIRLSNQQLADSSKGNVSASMMYSLARFDAWISAAGWNNAQEFEASKEETIEYFLQRFKMMLTENIDDYVKNFDYYIKGR